MRFLKLTLAVLVLACAAGVAQNTPQNVSFNSPVYQAPDFSAVFPTPDDIKSPVAYSSEEIPLQNGAHTTLHEYTLSLHNDADAFMLMYCDIPNVRGDTAALDQMLDGALAKLDNAKPASKVDATYSGLPARMVTATGTYTKGQTTFKVTAYHRVAVQGNRLWQGIVICDQRTACSEADAMRFLNSIKIQ